MEKCNTRECCCKCKFYTSLNKHPWNSGLHKGGMSEKTGLYACTAEKEIGEKRRSIISTSKHRIGCEMFTKDDRKLI